jgi:hypothetical protein
VQFKASGFGEEFQDEVSLEKEGVFLAFQKCQFDK